MLYETTLLILVVAILAKLFILEKNTYVRLVNQSTMIYELRRTVEKRLEDHHLHDNKE